MLDNDCFLKTFIAKEALIETFETSFLNCLPSLKTLITVELSYNECYSIAFSRPKLN